MEERHRTILRKSRVIFIQSLCDIERLCDRLYGYGILTDSMMAEVKSENSKESQARKILDIIPRRGQRAYDFFYQSLIETGQQELADILKPELATRPHLKKAQTVDEVAGPSKRYDKSSFQHSSSSPLPSNENLSFPGVSLSTERYQENPSHIVHAVIPDFVPENIEPMKITLQKCNREEVMRKSESFYPLESNPRGKTIIINNFVFDGCNLPSRDEQCHDLSASSIGLLFAKLKFRVQNKSNISAKEFLEVVETEIKNEEQYDCFVMVILTHGIGDLIFMKDGQPLKIQNVIDYFDSENCPKLEGKPKLFFIHACPADCYTPDSINLESILPTEHDQTHKLTKADVFLARATTYDPIASQSQSKGFWFIQAFVYIMKYHAHENHLLEIMTKVNGLAKENNQLSESRNTLRKDLYFFPG